MKIVQISDTHLSPDPAHFNANIAALTQFIADVGADLVIHTGDVTIDGAIRPEELDFAVDLLKRHISVPMLMLPGNHDVGFRADSGVAVTPERLARWHAAVGADHWVQDVAGWRLVGVNALLFGSGLAEEESQLRWLEAQLASAAPRRIAMFGHCPLYTRMPQERDAGYWAPDLDARAPLLDLLARYDVALYASGHLHRCGMFKHGTTDLVWAPPTSFVIRANPEGLPGETRLGAVLYHLETDRLTAQIHEVAVMIGGRLLQIAPPREIYENPAHLEVARFIGQPRINLIPAEATEGVVRAAGLAVGTTAHKGPLSLAIRPEHLSLGQGGQAGLAADVARVEFLGSELVVQCRLGDLMIQARLDPQAGALWQVGQSCTLQFDPDHLLAFAPSGERMALAALPERAHHVLA